MCLQYLSFSKAVSKERLKTPCNQATFKPNLEILNEIGKSERSKLGLEISILYRKKIRKRISYVENNLIYVIDIYYYHYYVFLALLF